MRGVIKKSIVQFDTAVTVHIQRLPAWLRLPMVLITTAGQPVVLGLAAGVIGYYAWRHGAWHVIYGLAAGLVAMMLNLVLKHYVHRPRPDTLYVSEMYFKTSSFPSGHALGAAVMCGLFGYVAVVYLYGVSGLICGLLGIFVLLIGVSRVYLGAHYPTDVVAGWVLGAIAATGIIMIMAV